MTVSVELSMDGIIAFSFLSCNRLAKYLLDSLLY